MRFAVLSTPAGNLIRRRPCTAPHRRRVRLAHSSIRCAQRAGRSRTKWLIREAQSSASRNCRLPARWQLRHSPQAGTRKRRLRMTQHRLQAPSTVHGSRSNMPRHTQRRPYPSTAHRRASPPLPTPCTAHPSRVPSSNRNRSCFERPNCRCDSHERRASRTHCVPLARRLPHGPGASSHQQARQASPCSSTARRSNTVWFRP